MFISKSFALTVILIMLLLANLTAQHSHIINSDIPLADSTVLSLSQDLFSADSKITSKVKMSAILAEFTLYKTMKHKHLIVRLDTTKVANYYIHSETSIVSFSTNVGSDTLDLIFSQNELQDLLINSHQPKEFDIRRVLKKIIRYKYVDQVDVDLEADAITVYRYKIENNNFKQRLAHKIFKADFFFDELGIPIVAFETSSLFIGY